MSKRDIWHDPDRRPIDTTKKLSKAELQRLQTSIVGPEEGRERIMRFCERVMANADDRIEANTLEDTASRWLRAHSVCLAAKDSGDIDLLEIASEWRGQVVAELKWRWAHAPGMHVSPEELALERSVSRRALTGKNEGRDAANRERKRQRVEREDEARTLASEYRARNPSASKRQTACWIKARLRQLGREDVPSVSTIRKYIQE